MFTRVLLLVLDGCGCGAQPDYARYHSRRTNTLGNLYQTVPHFSLPFLERLGLSQIVQNKRADASATYGIMRQASRGNDTFAGAWEMMGVPFPTRFRSGYRGLPLSIKRRMQSPTGVSAVCNRYVSGYKALDAYYDEHVRTGKPILYLADDGVILVAAHKDVLTPSRLNANAAKLARVFRSAGDYSRIITRPFTGRPGGFVRLEEARKDFILTPLPRRTVFQKCVERGVRVRLTEHLWRIFGSPNGVDPLTGSFRNAELMRHIEGDVRHARYKFGMYVLQDTDNFGHRQDIKGFCDALRKIDRRLRALTRVFRPRDLLIVTADHGCDPTIAMRGHGREHVPLLLFSVLGLRPGFLGVRRTFADVGQTLCEILHLPPRKQGTSFLSAILP